MFIIGGEKMQYFINNVEVTEAMYNDFIRVTDDTVAFIEEMEEMEQLEEQLSLF